MLQLERFDAQEAEATGSGTRAIITTRNGHPVVNYRDDEDSVIDFIGTMPLDYDQGLVSVHLDWAAVSDNSGNVKWAVAFERIAPGGQDLDADGFAAARTVLSAAAATIGVTSRATLTFSQAQMDGINPLDPFRMRVTRLGSEGDDDTLTGNVDLLRAQIHQ